MLVSMSTGRLLSALVVVALGLLVVESAFADGSGSAVPVATGSGSGSGASPATMPTDSEAIALGSEAYHKKDWFMFAGAAMALLVSAARWLLTKKWPRWEEAHYGVLLAGIIAGMTALTIAWTQPEGIASSHTLVGAVKLFAFAVAAYVVPKKVSEGLKSTGTASSSDVPVK